MEPMLEPGAADDHGNIRSPIHFNLQRHLGSGQQVATAAGSCNLKSTLIAAGALAHDGALALTRPVYSAMAISAISF